MTRDVTPVPRVMRADELRAWAVGVVGIAYWANVIRDPAIGAESRVGGAFEGVLNNGAFDVFAWALIFWGCFTIREDRPASIRQIVWVALLGLIALVPVRLASAAALALLGGVLFGGPGCPRAVSRMRILVFVLAIETVWMTASLAPLHMLATRFDAQMTATLLRVLGQTAFAHGNAVDNVSGNFGIEIWPYCSSTLPLAPVGLAFLVMLLHRGTALRLAHLPWLALSMMASVALTEIRLSLLAWNEANYHWWHDGSGATVYVLAALGLAVLVPVLADRAPAAAKSNSVVRSPA